MKSLDNLTPLLATHPGEILLDEMKANDYNQIDFAKLIGYERSQLNEIIKGKRKVNADLAILLEKALDIDADYWMETQKNFDLDSAKIEAKNQERLEAIEQWKLYEQYISFKFFKKEGILSGDPILDIPVIKNVYNVPDLEQLVAIKVQPMYSRFRKSTKLSNDPINIIGWTKLVQFKASQIDIRKFEIEKKEELISELKKIITTNIDTFENVKMTLNKFGIKIVFQNKGEKTPVDGISFWSGNNPTIGISMRHKRLDNFAFTLFHELGHIFEHLSKNKNAEFIDLVEDEDAYKNSIEEKEANEFALNNLIDKEIWRNFIKEYIRYSDERVKDLGRKCNIHPSIVKGRICFETGVYRVKSKIDNKIR